MHYRKINNLTGWFVFLIAATVYLKTIEPTVSFWDCGEFISSCFGLMIPHPPGAPLFILLGRFFILLFGAQPATAALAVNSMSALASAFTILFLFWTITHFARKISQDTVAVMAAGVVGALAYTFSDSFWFSAVEGEVYALSSLFTALVFWAALKWAERANEPRADRWLVFIFFLMGLSIGVHLLNLLVIPAIIMLYYFKRFRFSRWGMLLAFVVGCAITGFVQVVFIQSTIKGAAATDIWFVNNLGLPFFSGFAFFFVLLSGLLALGIRWARKRGSREWQVALWSMAFLLMGYSTYLTTMIRSNADPAVDMFNVDNPVALAGYLGRDQYNDWPILYGPDFTDKADYVQKGELYTRDDNKYVVEKPIFKKDWAHTPSSHFFPRMWDADDDRNQLRCYQQFAGVDINERPTLVDNIRYFTNYQAGWMYFRYFMWNFAGRQNDLQGLGNPADSNWVSGIPLIDNARLGDQPKMPDSMHAGNKAFNRLFFLPLLLGLGGLYWQWKKDKKGWLVNGLLFFFTGLAVVIYLNQSGFQPRERDYAFVGSFYAFAIWIGLGVLALVAAAQRRSASPVWRYAAVVICLAVPAWMALQEWDDHDRSQKTLARDMARNYLESCPPNALLITAEDNDTYMLWYLQNVEGVRKDVRVVVNTIFATDWYINQLRYKINESAPFDVLFTKDQIRGDKRDVVYFAPMPGVDSTAYYDLKTTLRDVVGSDDPRLQRQTERGDAINILPVRRFSVPVNEGTVRANGTVYANEKPVAALQLDIKNKPYLLKNDLALLAILSANDWARPICFTNTNDLDALDLTKYARVEGMVYRLVPIENPAIAPRSYDLVMRSFTYGGANRKNVYFDEDNRRRFSLLAMAHARIANGLLAQGKTAEAKQVLTHFDDQLKTTSYQYGMASSRGASHNAISLQFLQACLQAGDKTLATKVAASLRQDLSQQMAYYQSLGTASLSDEQLARQALSIAQGKGGDLSNRQMEMLMEIITAYQLLQQMEAFRI